MNKIIEKIHRISNAMLKELMASLIAVAIVTTGAIFIYAALNSGGGNAGDYQSWAPGGPPKAAPGVGNVAVYWDNKASTRQDKPLAIFHEGNVEINGDLTVTGKINGAGGGAAGSIVGGGVYSVTYSGGGSMSGFTKHCSSNDLWGGATCAAPQVSYYSGADTIYQVENEIINCSTG